MIDLLKKWLFRKWSNWEIDRAENVKDKYDKTIYRITFMKSVSNDGLIRYRKIKN